MDGWDVTDATKGGGRTRDRAVPGTQMRLWLVQIRQVVYVKAHSDPELLPPSAYRKPNLNLLLALPSVLLFARRAAGCGLRSLGSGIRYLPLGEVLVVRFLLTIVSPGSFLSQQALLS
jgi:hypothetical protein